MGQRERAVQSNHRPTVKFRRMKDRRRDQIMAAAWKVFARRGVASASIADITRAAKISVGTFYLYFPNKEELLGRLLDESTRILRQTLAEAFETAGPPLDRFERAGRAFFRNFCLRRREMLILILRESVGFSPAIENKRKRMFQILIGDVAGAITRVTGAAGRPGRRQSEVVAVSIIGMLERVAYHYYIWQTGTKDLSKVETEALNFIRDGLGSVLPRGE